MKLIFFIIVLVATNYLFSQGNLQFNQVKLVSTLETVPAGKIWRIDSYAYNGGPGFAGTASGTYVNDGLNTITYLNLIGTYLINGQPNQIPISLSRGGNGSNIRVELNLFPFWLPAGFTLAAGTNLRHMNVVEFNIIP